MSISAITPVASSVIKTGDAIQFTIDNTYTLIQISAQLAAGWDIAYDTGLGGAQAGYTVVVTNIGGGQQTFSVSRDAGWDATPLEIRVIEDESGSSTTTNITYYLANTQSFPQNSGPLFDTFTGNLIITDNDVVVSQIVGWLDIAGSGYTLVNLGNGKVRLTITGGGSGVLDNFTAIVAPTVNNDNTEGYSAKSVWFDTVGGGLYMATSVATGAANWIQINSTVTPNPSRVFGYGTWTYDNNTAGAGIAAGQFRLNNANPTAATQLFLRFDNREGVNLTATILQDLVGHRLSFWNENGTEGFVCDVDTYSGAGGTYATYGISNVVGDTSLVNTEIFGVTYVVPPGGIGDVVGPASAADGAVALFDGTTGKLLKDDGTLSVDGFGKLTGTQGIESTFLEETSEGIVFNEQASVTNPGAGKGKVYVKDDVPSRARFIDDAGNIFYVPIVPIAGITDNFLLTFNGTTGEVDGTDPATIGANSIALQFAGRAANAGINTYLQNSAAAPWDYTGFNQTRSGAQGSPNTPNNGSTSPAGCAMVPFDGTIVKVTGWLNSGLIANTGDLELWRWRPTDDALLSTAAGVQVNGAQLQTFGGASAANNLKYFEIDNPSNGAVLAGDLLEPLIYVDGLTLNGAAHFGFTVVIEGN